MTSTVEYMECLRLLERNPELVVEALFKNVAKVEDISLGVPVVFQPEATSFGGYVVMQKGKQRLRRAARRSDTTANPK